MARTMPLASQRRLQDLSVSSPSFWTQPCTDQHLWRMSQLISDWREMAPALGLTRTDEMNIMEYAPHSLPAQRVEMLRTWRHKLGTLATYSRLADVFSQCGKQNLVDAITELVATASAESAHSMIISSIPSPSGSTQTTATSHDNFSSFSNQLSSRYTIPPNHLPYNSFRRCFWPVQQLVLPPSYPQTYLSSYPYILQQGNNPTRAHAPSDFTSLPPNPVHLNQQCSVLPSHTNTPILHQNPSFRYEQHSLSSHSSCPPHHSHHYHHRLSSQPFPLYSSTDPNGVTTAAATATSHLSLSPPDVRSLTSQVSSMTTSSTKTPTLPSGSTQPTSPSHNQVSFFSNQPLSRFRNFLRKFKRTPQHMQSDSTRHSPNRPYHEQSSHHQQSSPHHHPRQSYSTSNRDSTTTAYQSLAPPSPPATTCTPSGVIATPAHQHPLSPAVQRYVTYLKNFYLNIDTPVYDKEHSLLQVKAKYFINIALVHKHSLKYMIDSDKNEMLMDRLNGHVDAIQKKKSRLYIHNVCKSQDGRLACSVLVEGAPGVGKTTFAYELCKRWARGEILWEWAAVVLIKLRDHTTRTAKIMYDLLYHPRPEVQQAVVDELIDHDGEGLLLILDGYDELTDSQKKSSSVIQQIMSKKLLCQSTLMVTSRPLATRTLHDNFVRSIHQHIEVLGFTEENIEEYIQSACGDKPELVEDFKSYLSSHPFSSALMFNPLQCAIVTDLYRSHWELGDKGFAPKTLTELYTGLVHIMLLRYLTQHPVYKHRDWWIKDLSNLPQKVSQQLKAVTKLAAEGIRKEQYVFDGVNTNIPSETFGFLQKEEVVASGIGMSASHNFLHLTLQEYLAAVYYSQQCRSPEQLSQLLTRDDLFPLNDFLEHYGKKRNPKLYSSATHWPVVLFVAGRTKLSDVPTNIFKIGLRDSDDDYITIVDVSLLHLLYETQSPQLIQSTLVTSRKYLSVTGISALDWFVIGYCIASSNSVWEVYKEVNFSPKHFEQLFMGLRLGYKQGTSSGNGTIGSVHVGGYWSGNLMILSQLQPYAKTVRKIEMVEQTQDVTHVGMSTRKSTNVKFSANYPMLEVLVIRDAEASSFSSILSFILEQNNLHTLSMTNCTIFSTTLICYLQSPHCSLQRLALLKCTISEPDECTQQIKTLNSMNAALHSLDISLSVLDHILSYINPSLTKLILHVDDIDTCSSRVETILQKIPSNFPLLETLKIDVCLYNFCSPLIPHQFIGLHLHTLSLCMCNLSSDIIRPLIHSLKSPHCKLYKLALYDCTIYTTDHTQLTTAIFSSTTITHLLFIDRNIDTPSLTALASGLKHNNTIEQLAVDKCTWKITEDQFQVLIYAVDNSAVKTLWLYDDSDYKKWFNDCTLSRKNIDIKWYSNYYMLYHKW